MTITVIGELSLGGAMPPVPVALGDELINVEAQVGALLAFQVTPPSIQTDLELNAEIAQNLTLGLGLGITPPSIDQQLAVVAARIELLLAQLGLLRALAGTLAASVHMYVYEGRVDALGSEIETELVGGLPGGGGADNCAAVVFVGTAPAAITALQALFKQDP